MVLFAAGMIGQAWAASFAEIGLTNPNPTDIDMFGDVLYVLDDDGWIYLYTGESWSDSSTGIKLHADNASPVGILAYDYATIYVLDKQGMVFVYGADTYVIPIHPENVNPVAITGYNATAYVADASGQLFIYAVQPNGEWIYDSSITLAVPNVLPSAIYAQYGLFHAAYVAGSTVHVFEYDRKWDVPFTISLENPRAGMDMTSLDDSIYVLKGYTIHEYDANGNPVIEYDIMLPATDPAGISVFDGQFYILDGTQVYRSDTWNIVAGISGTSLPTGLFVYDDIGVYVSDDISDGVYTNSTHSTQLHSDNTHPSGITYHDNTAYVADSDGHVYMYNVLSGEEWTHESTIILDAQNRSPTGVTLNNQVLYVVDNSTNTIYGYVGDDLWSLVGTIPLHDDNSDPTGIVLYGSRLYVLDGNGVVYSYVNTIDNWIWSHSILLHSKDQTPVGISMSDDIMHVAYGDGISHAYDKSLAYTGVVNSTEYGDTPNYNIHMHPENGSPSDIRLYEGVLYVLDSADDAIYVYDQFNEAWFYSYHFSLNQHNLNPVGMVIDADQMYVVNDDNILHVYQLLHSTQSDTPPVNSPQLYLLNFAGSGGTSDNGSSDTSSSANSRLSPLLFCNSSNIWFLECTNDVYYVPPSDDDDAAPPVDDTSAGVISDPAIKTIDRTPDNVQERTTDGGDQNRSCPLAYDYWCDGHGYQK